MTVEPGEASAAVPVAAQARIERALWVAGRGLMGYGIASVVLASLAIVGTLVVAIRLDGSSHRLSDRVAQVALTLDTTAKALDESVAGAQRLGTTLDELGPTLERTTSSLRSGSRTLGQLATTAQGIAILGQRPFAELATSLTATAAELEGLATSVEGNATTLDESRAAVDRMAAALPPVATSIRSLRMDLEPDVRAVLDDVWRIVPLAGAAFALWLGLPGLGAFALGRRMLRALER